MKQAYLHKNIQIIPLLFRDKKGGRSIFLFRLLFSIFRNLLSETQMTNFADNKTGSFS